MPRRIVDLTKPIAANGENGRFIVREFEHPDRGHSGHHRVELDTSVGTHVLTPRRLLRWGDALDDIPVETFFGEGLVLRVGGDETVEVGSAELDEVAGSRLRQGDIVVLAAEGSAEIGERVETCRGLQRMRFSESRLSSNCEMGPVEVREFCQRLLEDAAKSLLKMAMDQLSLSARSFHRVLKVSRTVADLAGAETITAAHLAEALQYRQRGTS